MLTLPVFSFDARATHVVEALRIGEASIGLLALCDLIDPLWRKHGGLVIRLGKPV